MNTSSSSSSPQQNTGSTSGANAPSVVGSGVAGTGGALVLGRGAQQGNVKSTTTVGKGGTLTINNPVDTADTQFAITALGNALGTATSNRDVISAGATIPTVQQLGTQTPTTGLVDSATSLISSSTFKWVAIGAAVIAAVGWLIYRKKK